MCGIAGIWDPSGRVVASSLRDSAKAMGDSLVHRGPDDAGLWIDKDARMALAHRRLSIIDLSPAGHQPMVSRCQRYVIVYNGEIYNFSELAADLRAGGTTFRGHSDTEVILEGCATWGLEATVERLIGMFAFALWDRQTRTLSLVRDRLGIKPLYWGRFGSLFLFASELKALRRCPGWDVELDRDSLCAYLRFNYVPAPRSIYRGVHKLEPGCILTLEDENEPVIERYWDLRQVAAEGLTDPLSMDDAEIVDAFEDLIADAVRRRMIADVPLGAFLSGGIDSSTVVALMQAQSQRPVRTFTIGFHEGSHNEARHAKAVAQHLGTDHTELYVEPQHARDVIPRLVEWWDEPFADSSQIPTFLVAELTRQHVTVALSGDGGDELFAGYNRYVWAERLWRKIRLMPRPVRNLAATGIRAVPMRSWDRVFRLLAERRRPRHPGDKLYKLADMLRLERPDELYRGFVSTWDDPASAVLGATEPGGLLWDQSLRESFPDFTDRMQFIDTLTYLPDDILTKVDRASMAVSLEARVPILDHRVVELAWRTPRRLMMKDGQSKWLLRQILYKHVPKAMVERPKMGFGVPMDDWLRGPLRDWVEDLISEERLRRDGIFDWKAVRERWAWHLKDRGAGHGPLWGVLMFQAWHDAWMAPEKEFTARSA
jgi:asparagine synthase (glutamine-hydrolysing)